MQGYRRRLGMKKSQVREVVQIAGNGFRVRVGALQRRLAISSTISTDSDSLCSGSGAANRTNRRVQSAPQYRTALRALAAHHSGQSGFPDVRHHPRFPCDDVRDGPTHRKLGSRDFAEKAGYCVHPWCSADSEPREARKVCLRVLRSYPTGQIWRRTLASRKDFQAATARADR